MIPPTHTLLIQNARGMLMFTLGVMFTLGARRFGMKQTGAFIALVAALYIEQAARRRLASAWRRYTGQLPGGDLHHRNRNNRSVLLFAHGQIVRVPAAHLDLMLRDGDFSAEDYEALLTLDQTNNAVQAQAAAASASKATIDALPVSVVKKKKKEEEEDEEASSSSPALEDELCAICMQVFTVGEEAKQMPCRHFFHTACLSEWLSIKATCPLCVAKVE